MEPQAYIEMNEVEESHWWFRGRRKIIKSIISKLQLDSDSTILEIGCGTGGNLHLLSQFGLVSAIEMDEYAKSVANSKFPNVNIQYGVMPGEVPFDKEEFDLVCMFDVLEHIDDDYSALKKAYDLLRPGGKLLLTVPAYQWMFGPHDDFLHHKRRYKKKEILSMSEQICFKPIKCSYFNTYLFPLAFISRLIDKCRSKSAGTEIPPYFINMILEVIFSSESFCLSRFNYPFGLSIVALLEK